MRTECVPIASIPHVTPLYNDYLSSFEKVSSYYPHHPLIRDWFADEAAFLQYPDDRRKKVADVLEAQNKIWGAGTKTLENITSFRKGAAAIVTGHQVSLFGGPLFSILKALTVVKIADEATSAGVDTVPIFWLATEDHDLAEVSFANLPGAHGLQRIAVAVAGKEGAPVSAVHFGEEITAAVESAAAVLGDNDVTKWLREFYQPGASLGDAFARLFTRIMDAHGVVFLDGSDPELHRIAQPIYVRAAELAPEITSALLQRNQGLEKAGYHSQVKVTNSSTPLFAVEDGVRTPVLQSNSHFSIGKKKLSREELAARITAAPKDFSGNALFRPVVQDYLLPTLAYVGGPAEVAYFAQAEVVYQKILGRVTPILPRISATLVEPQIERKLTKYKLFLPTVFHGEEILASILATHSLPHELAAKFTSAKDTLEKMLESLDASLEKLDPTIKDAALKSGSKMRYQLSRLESRASSAERRRNLELDRHARQISHALYPHKTLQEREIAGIYFLARYGVPWLAELKDSLQSDYPGHQVVYL